MFLNNAEWIPSGTDIIKLETYRKKVLTEAVSSFEIKHFRLLNLKSTQLHSAAYIISRECAKKILTKMEFIEAPIDNFIFGEEYFTRHDILIRQLSPAICIQSDLESTILFDRSKVRKNVRPTFLKRMKRELLRLITKSRMGIKGVYINLFTGLKWSKIPYRG